MWRREVLAGVALLGMTGLTGCFSSVHRVQKVQAQAPGTQKTASAEALEQVIQQRDEAIQTLNATVLITASTGGAKTGKVKTYTSFQGYIFVQKPRQLRVILKLPVIGSRAMDMVSDGTKFTLLIPPKSRVIIGTNAVTKPSANGLENLRPAVFLDSLLVPGVPFTDFVGLSESSRVLPPERGRKDAVDESDYDLAVLRVQSGNILHQERLVHFSRQDLLPVEQDVYNDEGQVVTQAVYSNYEPSGTLMFPRVITIRRPLDEYELKIEVTKLTLNGKFDSDQFEAPEIPKTFKVERMP